MNRREQTVFDNLFELSTDMVPVDGSRHVAAVIRKGIIWGLGYNVAKTDPMQQRFCDIEGKAFMHAEMSAIKRACSKLRTNDLSGYTIVVVRSKYNQDKDDVLGNSKPCAACQSAIDAYGLGRTIYSVDDGYGVVTA